MLALAALVIVIATWAASVGPDPVFRGEGEGSRSEQSAPPDSADPLAAPEDDDDVERRGEEREPPGWLQVLGFLAQLGAALVFLYLLVRLVGLARRLWPGRRSRRESPEEIDFDVIESSEVVARAIVRDGPDQIALLQEGAPRNGIVECWHRFEVQARSAGLGRKPWETSSEFTLRLLDLVEADVEAVSTLAGLYREARFSDHDVEEVERRRALDALERIHRGLVVHQ